MYFELTNQALSTILLDCIQYYPTYEQSKEAYGILLGSEEGDCCIGEYSFPVGNVDFRDQTGIAANREINQLIMNAKKIVATSTAVASYHSHPFDNAYVDWARPSNDDCYYFANDPLQAQLIIAIAQIYDEPQSFKLVYEKDRAREFLPTTESELPLENDLEREVQYIQGKFGRYAFEVRAYFNTGKSLSDINLFSSEVALNMTLWENDLHIERLPAEAMYSIRKLEYAHRQRSTRGTDNKIQYHIEKIKRMEPRQKSFEKLEDQRLIDGLVFNKCSSLVYQDAVQWARTGDLYAELHEETIVLCKVQFDANAQVLFLEDLEQQVGSTIDVAEYMVEAGYIEQISLCNIQRWPLHFWLREGIHR
ncbi:MPN domain-containing protein [Sporosarcina beigongshangi]|uniref:hypothetical protein n=1 Tax=Sporosarcina beigongshangi TaxID=2782538 RepID=UPI001939998D|nr:hypothetical protein [Sporosarcina beigongshangi]